MNAAGHPAAPPRPLGCAVITASDSRTLADDESGLQAVDMIRGAGHQVLMHRVVPDDPAAIRAAVAEVEADPEVFAVVISGGTGIAPRDRTLEAVQALIERPLPGFGELFRALSFDEVGAVALLSRAVAGVRGRRAIFSVPGSPAAVRLALERLVLPVLPHLADQVGYS